MWFWLSVMTTTEKAVDKTAITSQRYTCTTIIFFYVGKKSNLIVLLHVHVYMSEKHRQGGMNDNWEERGKQTQTTANIIL